MRNGVTLQHQHTLYMLTFPDAKINLGLNVVSRRPDGYHNIVTVMMPIPSHDILEVVPSVSGVDSLHTCGRPVDCPMEKNLVYKALQQMRRHADVPPVDIYLDKQTPDGAGLGGGSADAAYMLRGLNTLFDLRFDDAALAAMASEIGADCPFFIYDRPMLCTGTGIEMQPFDLGLPENLWLAVIKPEVSVPTREAYAMLTPREPAEPLTRVLSLPIGQWQGRLINDFEPGIISRHPVVGRVKQHLLDIGAVYASMSGSGSAVFGLFTDQIDPQSIKPSGVDGCYIFSKIN